MTAISLAHFSKERQDIKIDVYEATAKYSETGAGVVFYMRPFKILQRLGLEADILKLLGKSEASFTPGECLMPHIIPIIRIYLRYRLHDGIEEI